MKKIRRLINFLVLTLAGLYLAIILLLNIPAVKGYIGSIASDYLRKKLDTRVEIGKVDIGLFNRITIDDVVIYDQLQKKSICVGRVSVNADIIDLVRQKGKVISISSAQLFGLDASLYKNTSQDKLNIQFILDSLASKDKTKTTPLNLDIASVVIRHGNIRYDQNDTPRLEGKFSTKHLNISDINANMHLHKVTDDSLNVDVHNLSFNEKSGLQLQQTSFSLVANKRHAKLNDFKLALPNTSLDIPSLAVDYRFENNKLSKDDIAYSITINNSTITPSDIGSLVSKVKAIDKPLELHADVKGNMREVTVSKLALRHADNLYVDCDAYASVEAPYHWAADVRNLRSNSSYITSILSLLGLETKIPAVVGKLGDVTLVAKADGDELSTVNLQGDIKTALGNANVKAARAGNKVSAYIDTPGLNLGEIIQNKQFGNISGIIDAEALLNNNQIVALKAKADVANFDYCSYRYNSIKVDGEYNAGQNVSGTVNVVSPNVDLAAKGSYNIDGSHTVLDAQIKNFQPSALHIPQLNIDGSYSGNIKADITGNKLQTMQGMVDVTSLTIRNKNINNTLNHLYAKKEQSGNYQTLKLVGDFGFVDAEGEFDYNTLVSSITSCLAEHLPTLPGLPKYQKSNNSIKLTAQIVDAEMISALLNIPLTLEKPLYLLADIDDCNNHFDMSLEMPKVNFKGNDYLNGYMHMNTVVDSLKAYINVDVPTSDNIFTHCSVKANAFDNRLSTRINFDNNGKQHIHGALNADAYFVEGMDGMPEARVHVLPSAVSLSDSIWNILSSDIYYSLGNLDISNLSMEHNDQFIQVNGSVTKDNDDDFLTLDLNDVNIASILGLVKFRSVKFGGNAFGKATIRNIFNKPLINADLKVKNFMFENGHLGDLAAKISWNTNGGDILVDAIARDGEENNTIIGGYISPQRKELDLDVRANGTNLDFLKTYTSSFIDNIDLHGNGRVRVYGPFKAIDLSGDAMVHGSAHLPSLNTTYTIPGDSVFLSAGDIYVLGGTILDKYGNQGIANGHIYHNHFKNITYAFDIDAKNLLGYDTHTFGGDTFYGTAYITGSCFINGRPGETLIDITGTPCQGTKFVYNVASPDAISNADFVHWNDRNHYEDDIKIVEEKKPLRSDLKINFDINATPDLTLELLMDPSNGDYISLNGSGNILANYYNKGAFNMIGNYTVDHGVYRLTIQNVIRRVFEFQSGGSIGFNGDAYNAKLNLQAMYPVNGVNLSDINIGKRFSNNNIRVNCLMDITGTPNEPRVGFSFDMPTVSSDIKSMVNSIFNNEEELNQQVLYLLAVGRFYNAQNYADATARQNQTSLAMQSILSGTISQQLSNVLGDVVGNNNWNFGANISTGDEGFNNAEYEGLVSGRLLNDRLLINGQFGYRDNPNATTSFIGDFDLRYMLLPSGNAAIKVYNQTNDKYFTKNSLNTQGVGLILKKDFTSWKELINLFRKN